MVGNITVNSSNWAADGTSIISNPHLTVAPGKHQAQGIEDRMSESVLTRKRKFT